MIHAQCQLCFEVVSGYSMDEVRALVEAHSAIHDNEIEKHGNNWLDHMSLNRRQMASLN